VFTQAEMEPQGQNNPTKKNFDTPHEFSIVGENITCKVNVFFLALCGGPLLLIY
jgi:hypothetical protein